MELGKAINYKTDKYAIMKTWNCVYVDVGNMRIRNRRNIKIGNYRKWIYQNVLIWCDEMQNK